MSAVDADASKVGKVVASCQGCRHRQDDQRSVEQRIPGLTSLGSAYGASIATSRLCVLHDCWVSPQDSCARFSATG